MYAAQSLRRAAQINPNGIATIFNDRRRTWREVEERVDRLAGGLLELGLSHGGRVAILALNSDLYFECLLSIPLAGGVVVPINTRLTAPELAYILKDSGAELLFVDDRFVPLVDEVKSMAGDLRGIVCLGPAPSQNNMLQYDSLLNAPPLTSVLNGSDALATILYTGGTTGQAKGVMLSHANLMANAMNAMLCLGYDENSVYLHAAPMFHAADGGQTLAVTIAGGTHVFMPSFDATGFLELVEREKVTHALLVPTMINTLVNVGDFAKYDVAALQCIGYGASPMPEAVIDKALKLLPRVRFVHGYGATETAPLITAIEFGSDTGVRSNSAITKSCGRAVPLVEVRICDSNDRELPRGTIGEVLARGPNVMLGYWKKPELTAEALRGGWYHTGDAGYMDEQGLVYLVDRLKDMIITGGENVYCTEVENAISNIDGVAEVAVIGIPHEKWGEAVHAIVVPQPGKVITPDQVTAHCHNVIAGYKCPRSVTIRRDPMPLSGAGKVLKSALREPYWRGYEKRVN